MCHFVANYPLKPNNEQNLSDGEEEQIKEGKRKENLYNPKTQQKQAQLVSKLNKQEGVSFKPKTNKSKNN